MQFHEKVQYLSSYKGLFNKLYYINSQIEKIRSPKIGETLGHPKSINEYLDDKKVVQEKMKEIESVIKNMSYSKNREILEYRFLEFLTFEEIALIVDKSKGHVYRLYKDGINEILNT